jgi:PTH1 family peptidyl-tRNA hydrolase
MKLIVGLGNVGAQYAPTRHNIGFMVLDHIAQEHSAAWHNEPRLRADMADFSIKGEKILLAKPSTMMNLSGLSVRQIMQFYKLSPSDIWVVHDDLDVPFGRLRLRTSGASGGHQGINSILQHVGNSFYRVRVGISMNDRATEAAEVYVLSRFKSDEAVHLPQIASRAGRIVIDALAADTAPDTTYDLLSDTAV